MGLPYEPTPPRFVLSGPKGFIRSLVVIPSSHSHAVVMDIAHAATVDEALRFCTHLAALGVAEVVAMHQGALILDIPRYRVLEAPER